MNPERFALATTDAPVRWATCLTIGVPSLTDIQALCYCYQTAEDAEARRAAFEAALGVPLAVRPISIRHQPPP